MSERINEISGIQSIMLLGMVIAIVRGYLNDDAIIRSFEPPKVTHFVTIATVMCYILLLDGYPTCSCSWPLS